MHYQSYPTMHCEKTPLLSKDGLRERGADISGCIVPIVPILKQGHDHLASSMRSTSNFKQGRPAKGKMPKRARNTRTVKLRR